MFKPYAIQAHLRLLLETEPLEPFTLTCLCRQVIKSLNEPKATAPSPTAQPPRFPKHHYNTSQTTRGEAASPHPAQAYLPLHRKERCHLLTQLRGKKKKSTREKSKHKASKATPPLCCKDASGARPTPRTPPAASGKHPEAGMSSPAGARTSWGEQSLAGITKPEKP